MVRPELLPKPDPATSAVTARAMAALKSRQHARETKRLPRGQFDRIKTFASIAEWLSVEKHRSFETPLHPVRLEAEQLSQKRSFMHVHRSR